MMIWKSMHNNIKLIPPSCRVKLLLRHSIRQGIDGIPAEFKCGLTREGEALAKLFGEQIPYNIGSLHSSPSPRCKQTAQCIIEGSKQQITLQENKTLSDLWIADSQLWHKTYKSHNQNISMLLQKMLNKENVQGAYDAKNKYSKIASYNGLKPRKLHSRHRATH